MIRDIRQLLPFSMKGWEQAWMVRAIPWAVQKAESRLAERFGVESPLTSAPEDWNIPPREVYENAIWLGFVAGWAIGMWVNKKARGIGLERCDVPGFEQAFEEFDRVLRDGVGFDEWADEWPSDDTPLSVILTALVRGSIIFSFRSYMKAAGLVGMPAPSLN